MKKGFYSYYGFVWLMLGFINVLMILLADEHTSKIRFGLYIIAACFFFALSIHHYIKYKRL